MGMRDSRVGVHHLKKDSSHKIPHIKLGCHERVTGLTQP